MLLQACMDGDDGGNHSGMIIVPISFCSSLSFHSKFVANHNGSLL